MIRHVLRALWRRRRAESLVVLEVLATFLVVAMVAAFAALFATRARLPLGFDAENVWRIEVEGVGEMGEAELIARRPELIRALAALPGVEQAAGLAIAPWDFSDMTRDTDELSMQVNSVTPELAEVLRLELVAGRFFEEADAALPWTPVVIDQALARRMFGEEDPIGKVAAVSGPEDPENRVVGVLSEFRENGELSGPTNYLMELATHQGIPRATDLVVRLSPAADATTERAMAELLREIAPEWSFQIRPMSELRRRAHRNTLAPLVTAAIAAAFLLGTVALGLTGIVWQNVARRTRELGLRRAIGATQVGILGQVVLEVAVLCAVGVACGALVLIQLPLFGFEVILPTPQLALGAAIAGMVVILAGALCALYPGRLAMRVAPAEALRQG